MSSAYYKYDQVVYEAKKAKNAYFEWPKQRTKALSTEFIVKG